MKLRLFGLLTVFLFQPFVCEAAAPSRTKTYVTGQTIVASDVTENEDNMFSYLQNGVDTYASGSVNAAAIASDAVGSAEIAADAVDVSELAESLTVAAGFVLDLSATSAGPILGQGTSCSGSTQGQACYDTDDDVLYVSTGSAMQAVPVFSVGSFSRDTSTASGTQDVTGLTGKPRACVFFMAQDASGEASFGVDNVSSANAIASRTPASAGTYGAVDNNSISDLQTAGTDEYNGEISAAAVGQFTITWTRTGSPTGTIKTYYLCAS